MEFSTVFCRKMLPRTSLPPHNKHMKIKNKREAACHNCRMAHKKCSSGTPCQRCQDKSLNCFPFDPSVQPYHTTTTLTTEKKYKTPVAESSAFEISCILEEIDQTKRKLEKVALQYSQLQDERLEMLQDPVLNRSVYKQQMLNSAHEIPTCVYNNHLLVVESNLAFRKLYRVSEERLSRGFSILYDMTPQRMLPSWIEMSEWIRMSRVRFLASMFITMNVDGVERTVQGGITRYKNYAVMTLAPANYLCDEFTVDDVVIPESFRVLHQENQTVCNMLTLPKSSFERLFTIVSRRQRRSGALNGTVQLFTPLPVQLKPVELTAEELTQVADRLESRYGPSPSTLQWIH